MLELWIFAVRIRESPKALLVCWFGSISTSTQTNKTLQFFYARGQNGLSTLDLTPLSGKTGWKAIEGMKVRFEAIKVN
jgi:hypothetical protein